jgi:RND family efflux transporter MFP subunit
METHPFRWQIRFKSFVLVAAAASLAIALRGAEVPAVAAVPVVRGDIFREVSFDAELKPYQEIELHVRATGYLDKIFVDAGDQVKEGQPIGVLDVPELRNDLTRGKAALQRAEANFKEAHLNYSRLVSVSKTQVDLVAQQDIDIAEAKDAAAAAALAEVKSEVEKLGTLENYTRINAPFAGVITKRYSDPGALIQAGTSTGSMPLVRLSQTDRLRVTFPVSVSYVSSVKVGDETTITVPSLGKAFKGKISRVTQKVETATRTMEAQVDLPNPDGVLIAGVYATVMVQMERKSNALLLPVEAVVRERGTATVFLINREKKLEPRTVTLGTESPRRLEVVSGIGEGELVMVGSRSQFNPGQQVEPKRVELPAL